MNMEGIPLKIFEFLKFLDNFYFKILSSLPKILSSSSKLYNNIIMLTFNVKVKMAFMAQVNFNNNNIIIIIMAIMAKIKLNYNSCDITIQGDITIIVWWCEGDLTTRREEEAAGLLLALPSSNSSTTTVEKKEEEMPSTGSLLLDLPLQLLQKQQQPFSQGLNVVNNTGKGGEGGDEEEKEEVPGHGSLLLLKNEKNKSEWCTMRALQKIEKNGKKKKLKISINPRKEFVFCGVVILDPHTHPSPPVACGWGLPAWGGGR